MQLDPLAVAAIAGMALATCATRFLGYWLVRHRPGGGGLPPPPGGGRAAR